MPSSCFTCLLPQKFLTISLKGNAFHSPMLFCLRKFHLCYTVIWLLVNLQARMKCYVFLIQPPQTDLALSAFHMYYHHCPYTTISLLHPYLPQCNLSQELLRDKHFFFSHSSLSLLASCLRIFWPNHEADSTLHVHMKHIKHISTKLGSLPN